MNMWLRIIQLAAMHLFDGYFFLFSLDSHSIPQARLKFTMCLRLASNSDVHNLLGVQACNATPNSTGDLALMEFYIVLIQ